MNTHECNYEMKIRGLRDGDGVFIPDLYPTCSYCGSLSVEAMLQAFRTPGVHYSGSDWKYGWPHKFYIDIPCEPYRRVSCSRSYLGETTHEHGMFTSRHHKFYSTHLNDATVEQLAQWNAEVAPRLGVWFEFQDAPKEVGGRLLIWKAQPNFQTHGVVNG